MTFKVPQFIEVEDKILGPLTIKQFVYVAGGVASILFFRAFFPLVFAILLGVPFIILGLMLAFYRLNDQPFIRILEAAFYFYVIKNRLYLWKKEPKAAEQVANTRQDENLLTVPKIAENKLKDLAWSLDIKEKVAEGGGSDSQ